ncbi:MAG TPA: ANTAR domain-containing protein [Ilumatobacteraceae bacterium]|nr:ANTAR domain-containing protein [Ilumatobacteraceae bacterium]
MNADQSLRIAVAFAREAAKSPEARLCSACVDVLDVTGAGITIMGGGGGGHAGPICVSNPRMAALEDLQYAIGEGPCQDAFKSNMFVHAPRLDVAAATLWPSFVDLAHSTGVGAVFAYPLSANGAKIGVLTLYQDDAGELSATQHEDSIAMVEVLTETVLSLQDAAPVGTLAADLDDVVAYRAEIHQASGMVSVQLQLPVAEALLRIRAYAFADGRPLGVVAREIVTRRLRLADDRVDLPRDPKEGE